MKFSLRAKFLILSGVVQLMVLILLIWNNLRVMGAAVERSAYRVAHEYAVTLNLTLGPYSANGRLPELKGYLAEMLSDQRDSFVRYIFVADDTGKALLQVGTVPQNLSSIFERGSLNSTDALVSKLNGSVLSVRTPILLQNGVTGSLSFGVSTDELTIASDTVFQQSIMISVLGFVAGLLLSIAFSAGIWRRLKEVTKYSQRLAQGNFDQLLRERGGDELEVLSSSLNYMGKALRDRIAQLTNAERNLKESEARFTILFETAPVPLSVTDKDGSVISTNLAWCRTFGQEHNAILERTEENFKYWIMKEERDRIWEIYERNGVVQGEIAKIRFSDLRAGYVAIWSSSLFLDGRQAIVWALLDMTEELNAREELNNLNSSLEDRVRQRSWELELANTELSTTLDSLKRTQYDLISAEKMASLGALVAGVSHELNTPIGNSLLAATTLSERVVEFRKILVSGSVQRSALHAQFDEIEKGCDLIAGSLHRAATLISSFKQMAVDQTNDQRRKFDLEHALKNTLDTYAPQLRRANCSVSLDVQGTISLDSYPGSLYQVINNLLNNALLHAFEDQNSGAIHLHASETIDNDVEIVFSDDGVGMTDHVLHHVFDPFFTTKMGAGGSGLGMNIVYNIVTEILGGRIKVESSRGQGTFIKMIIPKSAPYRASKSRSP